MSGNSTILSLDVGEARIGVAIANSFAKIPNPMKHLENNPNIIQQINDLIDQNEVKLIVIGLPQNIEGKDTEQAKKIREFAEKLILSTKIPIKFCDESNTSKLAENDLRSKSKPYSKGEIDSISAAIILQRFFEDHNNDLTNLFQELELYK